MQHVHEKLNGRGDQEQACSGDQAKGNGEKSEPEGTWMLDEGIGPRLHQFIPHTGIYVGLLEGDFEEQRVHEQAD